MKKTYSDDEEMDKLREDLNSSIIKLNSDLGTLNSEMSDCYKDNEITYEEKIGIEEGITLILNSKSEVLKYVNKVVLICEEDNQNENLIALNSGISALENAHENLVQNITVAISDSVTFSCFITSFILAFNSECFEAYLLYSSFKVCLYGSTKYSSL